jgi:hypothetical protein
MSDAAFVASKESKASGRTAVGPVVATFKYVSNLSGI